MPRETIRKLHEDIGRILVAGAHLAAADSELAKDKAKLDALVQQLGDKAPVIAQIGSMIDKVAKAQTKELASDLMTLAVTAQQVRAAQASLAPAEGTPQALEAVPEVGTPCNARELYELRDALTVKGEGRMPKIEAGIERQDIADLRLVDALVQAMSDPWIGEKVSTEAVPLLGKAAVEPLRRRLNVKGGAVDSRRLRALVAVERAAAKEILEKAVREGSAELREAALDAIADYVPGQPEFEPLVLELLTSEKSGGVRRAGVRALAGYGSDASLTALLAALDDESTRDAASEALQSSKHPNVAERLLEKLGEAIAKAGEKKEKPKKAAATSNGKKETKGKKEKAEDPKAMVRTLLYAVAPHPDPRIAARAFELCDEYGAPAAYAVIAGGNPAQLKKVADLLAGDDPSLFPAAVQAALKLGGDEAFKRLAAPLKARDRDSKVGVVRARAAAEGSLHVPDVRWVDLLIDVVAKASPAVAAPAAQVLGRLGDKKAMKPLLKAVQATAGKKKRPSWDSDETRLCNYALQALSELKDPAAFEPLLELLAQGAFAWGAQNALAEMADASKVDIVRTMFAKMDAGANGRWALRCLLNRLERQFPGA